MSVQRTTGFFIALGFVAWAGAAHADKIDGNWCRGDGSRFSIDGPVIVTPGGNRIDGNYFRHYFNYVVPPSEPGAGGTVNMVLVDPDTVELTPPGAASTETWVRCAPPVSLRAAPRLGLPS